MIPEELTAAEAKSLIDERGTTGWTVEQAAGLLERLWPSDQRRFLAAALFLAAAAGSEEERDLAALLAGAMRRVVADGVDPALALAEAAEMLPTMYGQEAR